MNVSAPMGAIPLLTSLISVEWLFIQLNVAPDYVVNPSQSCLCLFFSFWGYRTASMQRIFRCKKCKSKKKPEKVLTLIWNWWRMESGHQRNGSRAKVNNGLLHGYQRSGQSGAPEHQEVLFSSFQGWNQNRAGPRHPPTHTHNAHIR